MTTTQTQLRRDTAANLALATPAVGEVGVNTTDGNLVLGDGATAGGLVQASAKAVQNNSHTYATAGGTANVITLTLAPSIGSYSAGQEFQFKASANNSGATTLNVNGKGAKNIYKMSSGTLGALASGDIISGAIYTVRYDGTQFQLQSAVSGGVVRVTQQIFTGAGTYTPSAGMLHCIVEVLGAGGGGGSANNTNMGGGGGGAGAFGKSWLTSAQIGASQVVTIGSAGSAGAGSAGGNGGTSSLGSLISCAGGNGGARGTSTASFAGGTGGTASNAELLVSGANGCPSVGSAFGGAGANSPYGAGAAATLTAASGAAGLGYGSGGAGGFGANGGGAGTAGLIVITEFCSV